MAPLLQCFHKEVNEAQIFLMECLRPQILHFTSLTSCIQKMLPIIVVCKLCLQSVIRLSSYKYFMSATCNDYSKVTVNIICELTYVQHPVAPDENHQYIWQTVKRKNFTFTLVGAYILTSSLFNNARLSAPLPATHRPQIFTGDINARHSLCGSLKMDCRES